LETSRDDTCALWDEQSSVAGCACEGQLGDGPWLNRFGCQVVTAPEQHVLMGVGHAWRTLGDIVRADRFDDACHTGFEVDG
jgi:hypothetical protein